MFTKLKVVCLHVHCVCTSGLLILLKSLLLYRAFCVCEIHGAEDITIIQQLSFHCGYLFDLVTCMPHAVSISFFSFHFIHLFYELLQCTKAYNYFFIYEHFSQRKAHSCNIRIANGNMNIQEGNGSKNFENVSSVTIVTS